MYLSIFAMSFTVALSGALAPGPLLAAVIYESARRGAKAGPLLMIGHAVLEIAMVAILIIGAGRFINNPGVLKGISIAGAIIFLLFGSKMLTSLPKISLPVKGLETKQSNLALTGITLSLANPYWTMWWLTIGLGLVLGAKQQGMLAVVAFFLGHILADLGWYSVVSLMLARGKKFISDKIYRAVMGVCGLALLAFGVYFAISAF